jgi:hypothetical protein
MNSTEMAQFEILLDILNQMACDINAIKCVMLTEFAQKRGMDVYKLSDDLAEAYKIKKENRNDKE